MATRIRSWLRQAVTRYGAHPVAYGHGFASALDEACYLLCHTLHLPQEKLEWFLDAELSPQEVRSLNGLLTRRLVGREPLPYLTQEAWQGDFKFFVDQRVLIPRSFIAHLLFEQLSPWMHPSPKPLDILEIGTGSGCLAIVAASMFEESRVLACDVSPKALQVAKRNVIDYALDDRVELLQSDVYRSIPASRTFDLIISNPPYVTQSAMDALPQEFRHEPALALAAGVDGLDIVRQLLADGYARLSKGGLMVIEVGHNKHLVEAAFPSLMLNWLDTPDSEGAVFLVERDDLKAIAATPRPSSSRRPARNVKPMPVPLR